MSNPTVEVHNLRKSYGQKVAVADISFSVEPGEIFGVLGPNGSGKTTAVECIAGLRDADGGHIRVLGIDPQTHPELIREHVGVQFQEAGLHDKITVHEALWRAPDWDATLPEAVPSGGDTAQPVGGTSR